MPKKNNWVQNCMAASVHDCYYFFCEKRGTCDKEKKMNENGGRLPDSMK